MSIPILPECIVTVRIPRYISPSRYSDLQECPLRVFINPSLFAGSLPPSPRMLFGILLHRVREEFIAGRWGPQVTPLEAIDFILEIETVQIDNLIKKEESLRRISPLPQAVGRVAWNTKRYEQRKWAERQKVKPSGDPPILIESIIPHFITKSQKEDVTQRVEFGPEAWIVCPSLRLRGRVDHLVKLSDGTIEVTDYKSGQIWDETQKRFAEQVRLYALAIEEALPGSQTHLYLEGTERISVEWDEKIKKRTLESLIHSLGQYPQEESRSAIDLGCPGKQCRGCQLRPLCPTYINSAPEWWKNTGNPPRPLPLDVWGTIIKVSSKIDTVSLELIDDAGRSVNIDGLDNQRGFNQKHIGQEIFLFDLEPSEAAIMHGMQIQPRNFHEHPTDGGISQSVARSLQIFLRSTSDD